MFILNKENSIANNLIAALRDEVVQRNPALFRNNLFQIGSMMAYEISKTLSYTPKEIHTPLAKTTIPICSSKIVLVTILRAGLPFYDGFLRLFPDAESAFIGARRVEKEGEDLDVDMGYLASPSLEGKEVIICDPMLATGKSLLKAIEGLTKFGKPKIIHFASIFAAPEGIEIIEKNLQHPHKFWVGSLETGLNDKFYIIPGLGDAGDLAFGPKI